MTAPHRVQRRRSKGWKMPPNTIYVGRPTIFGNPFTVADCRVAHFPGSKIDMATWCTDAFRRWLIDPLHWDEWIGHESYDLRLRILTNIPSLRGKNLACWCPLDAPCHADVLCSIANAQDSFIANHILAGNR